MTIKKKKNKNLTYTTNLKTKKNMKTPYVNMGLQLQQKSGYLEQLFELGSHETSEPRKIIVMNFTQEKDEKIPEIILNIKWSVGIEFGLIKKNDEINNYTVQKSLVDQTGWIRGRNFREGVNNLWEEISTKIVVVKKWKYKKGDYHLYEWNDDTKEFVEFVPK
ncbi:TPA: hypothetical protein DCZ39_06190 [Patescibacteria group bacterium]|nr:hypothetical protein [Candidatus Gracilibacteria bacterium]